MKIIISSKNLHEMLKRISLLSVTNFRFIKNGMEFIAKGQPAIYLGCETDHFEHVNSDDHLIFNFDKSQWANISTCLGLMLEQPVVIEFDEGKIIISQCELHFSPIEKFS